MKRTIKKKEKNRRSELMMTMMIKHHLKMRMVKEEVHRGMCRVRRQSQLPAQKQRLITH